MIGFAKKAHECARKNGKIDNSATDRGVTCPAQKRKRGRGPNNEGPERLVGSQIRASRTNSHARASLKKDEEEHPEEAVAARCCSAI